jgi:hypothetical protein
LFYTIDIFYYPLRLPMITAPNRPNEAIERLVTALTPLGNPLEIAPRKRLNWESGGTPFIYVFLKGEISISRASDGILVATVTEPHIFGFAEMFHPMRSNMMRAEIACQMLRVDGDKAEQAIERHGLWRDVAEMLAFHTNAMLYRDLLIVNQRTYPIVCHYLRELDSQPEETKSRVNILTYIQQRTGLSRSSILNIVSSLKTERFIDFDRGGYNVKVFSLPNEM